jgi:1,4-dihydroxy-2-naphthoate octaprenyltransferase
VTVEVAGHMNGLCAWLAVWWRASRPFSLTASVTPVLVGSAAALRDARFHPDLFLATLTASMSIQAATNMINEYYDYVRSVDRPDSLGPSGVILRGLLSPRAVLGGGLTLFAVGGLLGVWLVIVAGWPILAVGVLSMLAGYAYTGGPWPLGYIGLGDLTVFTFMGPVIVLGAYYVQAHTITWTVVWASCPVATLVTAILVVNNLRDIEDDRCAGKRTLATFLGPRSTRVEYVGLLVFAYLSAAIGILLRYLPPAMVLVFLTIPQGVGLCRGVWAHTDPVPLTRDLRDTAKLHQRAGWLLALAFILR